MAAGPGPRSPRRVVMAIPTSALYASTKVFSASTRASLSGSTSVSAAASCCRFQNTACGWRPKA